MLKILIIAALSLCFLHNLSVAAAETAPDCALSDFNHPERIIHLKPNKDVVYVDFWASWCGPCVKSFPFLEHLHQQYHKKGLKIIAINLDDSKKDAEEFLKAYPVSFQIVQDPDGLCPEKFGLTVMPSSYLIDRQGNIHHTGLGFNKAEVLEMSKKIDQLLK